jgi:GT2 family glycosyltransferase
MVEQRFQAMAGERWASLRLIQNKKNEGCYIPYNLVVPFLAPQTEYILGLDADVEIDPTALSHLVEAVSGKRVAVVGARSVVYSNPAQTAHGAGFVNRWTATYSDRDARERIECDYVIGCCWLLDRRIFQELGGFSPDFFINHWEVDYCLRAKTRRWRILYEPAAVAKHKVQYPATCSAERLYYMFRNKLLMIRNNDYFKSRSLAMALCVLLSFGRILSSAIQTGNVKGAFNVWHGLYDGLRNVTGAISQGP